MRERIRGVLDAYRLPETITRYCLSEGDKDNVPNAISCVLSDQYSRHLSKYQSWYNALYGTKSPFCMTQPTTAFRAGNGKRLFFCTAWQKLLCLYLAIQPGGIFASNDNVGRFFREQFALLSAPEQVIFDMMQQDDELFQPLLLQSFMSGRFGMGRFGASGIAEYMASQSLIDGNQLNIGFLDKGWESHAKLSFQEESLTDVGCPIVPTFYYASDWGWTLKRFIPDIIQSYLKQVLLKKAGKAGVMVTRTCERLHELIRLASDETVDGDSIRKASAQLPFFLSNYHICWQMYAAQLKEQSFIPSKVIKSIGMDIRFDNSLGGRYAREKAMEKVSMLLVPLFYQARNQREGILHSPGNDLFKWSGIITPEMAKMQSNPEIAGTIGRETSGLDLGYMNTVLGKSTELIHRYESLWMQWHHRIPDEMKVLVAECFTGPHELQL